MSTYKVSLNIALNLLTFTNKNTVTSSGIGRVRWPNLALRYCYGKDNEYIFAVIKGEMYEGK